MGSSMVRIVILASGAAVVQHWSHPGQRPRLYLALAPRAENETANSESDEWPAHVDENKRPRICLEGGERRDRRVLDKEKCEPADDRNLQTSGGVRGIESVDEPRKRVVHKDRRDDREQIRNKAMCPLDVSRRLGVIIQPGLAKDGVPAEPDQLVDNYKNPNRNVTNLRVHRLFDYPDAAIRIASRFTQMFHVDPTMVAQVPSRESPPQ